MVPSAAVVPLVAVLSLAAALAGPRAVRGQIPATVSPRVGIPSEPVDEYPRTRGVEVLHYDLEIEIPEFGPEITGRTAIFYEVTRDGTDSLALDLVGLTVDRVEVDGERVPFDHAGGRLLLRLPPVPQGSRREATVWYHGEPQDGLIVGENRHGERVVFADNWATRARSWFPAVDHPSDKATVEMTVVAASRMEVVGNGYLRESVDLGDGRTRTTWAETAEIPTYTIVFGAAEFAIESAGVVDGIEVTHWTYPADSAAGAAAFARSTEILAFYDSLFGPYPYEKLAHVQSTTRYGGMENASAIFYGEETIGNALETGAGVEGEARDALTSLVAHETVHQWFGDAVTGSDWHHLWLSEGFATYFAAVFFEFHGGARGRGPAELARRMAAMTEAIFEHAAETGLPIYAPASGAGDFQHLLNPNNYQKGAWVLHMLRGLVGDVAFFRGMRDYYATLRDGTAWTADFERIMEDASGRDLGWFFAQWVGRPGHPVLEVESGPGVGGTRVIIRQLQDGEPFRLGFDLVLRWDGGERRERIEMSSREAAHVFDTPAPVRDLALDPDGWLLHERAATRTGADP
ncbi:MAG TPA: M1 family metallopeptidase [Gemmatimonadota bacterium]|nr:M1 family metallopeptidase [Gemmatimonadota bacterium]